MSLLAHVFQEINNKETVITITEKKIKINFGSVYYFRLLRIPNSKQKAELRKLFYQQKIFASIFFLKHFSDGGACSSGPDFPIGNSLRTVLECAKSVNGYSLPKRWIFLLKLVVVSQ